MYDLHNVDNLSVDVKHVLVLSYYLVNNKMFKTKQNYTQTFPLNYDGKGKKTHDLSPSR